MYQCAVIEHNGNGTRTHQNIADDKVGQPNPHQPQLPAEQRQCASGKSNIEKKSEHGW